MPEPSCSASVRSLRRSDKRSPATRSIRSFWRPTAEVSQNAAESWITSGRSCSPKENRYRKPWKQRSHLSNSSPYPLCVRQIKSPGTAAFSDSSGGLAITYSISSFSLSMTSSAAFYFMIHTRKYIYHASILFIDRSTFVYILHLADIIGHIISVVFLGKHLQHIAVLIVFRRPRHRHRTNSSV